MARTQIERPFRLKSTLGDDALLLESFEGGERMSTPFRYTIRALSENPNVNMKELLTKPLVLTLVLHNGERHIHGNISRMKLAGTGEDGLALFEIEIVPWIWFLNLFTNCRIFQNKSVPDIVTQIFTDRGYSAFRNHLQGTYAPREYCVQYRETDFNFVSRLLEEEGIYYYFEQSVDKHTLVLGDTKQDLASCPGQAEVRYQPSDGGLLENDTVQTLEEELHVHIGTASLTDYDFIKPSTSLYATISGDNQPGELYDYPGRYVSKAEGDKLARIRLEEQEVQLTTVRGQTNCTALECGYKFTLKEHYRDDANKEYAITALHQRGRNSSYRSNADPSAYEYANDIEAIPATVSFRPPRIAKKPVIRGSQTAVVVGKAGEEIWTDQYGRVIVQFFWDRNGKDDENSSCWVRVSHQWAGKHWGAIYIPRIGQEVIVSFLEGDPDRPIITGRVYNADQMPPYPLPDEQTKSTVKSMSSKGGGGFNEIRFEDKKGSEQIFVHGEKDQDIRIKNDRKEWIGNDRHLFVVNDKFEKIGNDEHSHVVANRNEKIEGNHSLAVSGNRGIKIDGNQSLAVTGNLTETVSGNHSLRGTQNLYIKGLQVVIEAEVGLTLKVGANFITVDPSGVSVKGTLIQLNSAGAALSGSPGQAVTLTKPADSKEADKAEPGGVTSAPGLSVPDPKAKLPLSTISPATKETEAPEEPERAAPSSSGGSGASSHTEIATFPKDVDAVAVAAVLKEAAESGVPFCEECEKARKAQAAPQPAGVSSDEESS